MKQILSYGAAIIVLLGLSAYVAHLEVAACRERGGVWCLRRDGHWGLHSDWTWWDRR